MEDEEIRRREVGGRRGWERRGREGGEGGRRGREGGAGEDKGGEKGKTRGGEGEKGKRRGCRQIT